MGMILSILVNAAALFVAAQLLSGITVADTGTLLLAALVFGVVNTFVKPLLTLLSLPITILTLGLFLLAVNALMFMLTSKLVPGFRVEGCLAAFLGSLVFSVLNLVVSAAFGI